MAPPPARRMCLHRPLPGRLPMLPRPHPGPPLAQDGRPRAARCVRPAGPSRRVSSSRRRSATIPASPHRAFRASAWAVLGSPAACAARAATVHASGVSSPRTACRVWSAAGPAPFARNASAPASMAGGCSGFAERASSRSGRARSGSPDRMRSPASKVAAPRRWLGDGRGREDHAVSCAGCDQRRDAVREGLGRDLGQRVQCGPRSMADGMVHAAGRGIHDRPQRPGCVTGLQLREGAQRGGLGDIARAPRVFPSQPSARPTTPVPPRGWHGRGPASRSSHAKVRARPRMPGCARGAGRAEHGSGFPCRGHRARWESRQGG